MKLVKYALLKNVWLWFHLFAGGLLAFAFLKFGMSDHQAVVIVFIAAVVWEILEVILMTLGIKNESAYGNDEISPMKHFFLDGLGAGDGSAGCSLTQILPNKEKILPNEDFVAIFATGT